VTGYFIDGEVTTPVTSASIDVISPAEGTVADHAPAGGPRWRCGI
jgi:hypothetical protein